MCAENGERNGLEFRFELRSNVGRFRLEARRNRYRLRCHGKRNDMQVLLRVLICVGRNRMFHARVFERKLQFGKREMRSGFHDDVRGYADAVQYDDRNGRAQRNENVDFRLQIHGQGRRPVQDMGNEINGRRVALHPSALRDRMRRNDSERFVYRLRYGNALQAHYRRLQRVCGRGELLLTPYVDEQHFHVLMYGMRRSLRFDLYEYGLRANVSELRESR